MFLGYIRDRIALIFTILIPVLFLVLLGSIYRGPATPKINVLEVGRVSMLDQARAASPGQLGEVMAVTRSSNLARALADVRKGTDDAAVQQQGTRLIVHYSVADPTKAAIANSVFSSIAQQANLAATGRPPRYQLTATQVEDKSLKAIQYLAPGLLGWAIASGAAFGAAITLVGWRKDKLLRRLRLAPVSTATVVTARIGMSVAIAIVQMFAFIAIAITPYFGLKLTASWWMAIPVVIAGTLAFMSIGLLVGAVSRTQQAATSIANLIILPMAFLGGAFIPAGLRTGLDPAGLLPDAAAVSGDRRAERDGPRPRPGLSAPGDRHPARLQRGNDRHRDPGVPVGRNLTACFAFLPLA
jgi:ABC-2 type transport system permease protein